MPKIVRFHETGGPEKLQVEDMPAQQPGRGEVSLRMQATGLNRSEAMFVRGLYSEKPVLPSRIGVEGAGVIQAVGPEVDASLIGKQVATVGGFSQSRYGVLGEESIVPVASVAEYDRELTPAQGAAVWISYLTAWGALVHIAGISAEDYVLIPAASSSVGLAAIQIVKDAGAIAIATTRTRQKREALFALGADHVVVSEEEDLPQRVRDITKQRGTRIIFDAVGGPYVETLAECAALGGTIFLYGGLAGQPTVYPVWVGMAKGISLRGYSMLAVRAKSEVLEEGTSFVRKRLRNRRFVPTIARTFTLAQAADAYRFLESNAQVGKVVIEI